MKKMQMLIVAGLTGLLLVGGTAGASVQQGGSACRTPHEFDSYRVEITPLTRSIKAGETARAVATVHRSIDGERDLVPAEGATVLVTLWKGDDVRSGGAVTDQEGRAVIEIPVDRKFPSGWAAASARATREPADLPCHPLQESGGTKVARFLRIL